MKIVNLKQFRALPNNTIFAKYKPSVFEEIQTKGDTLEYDFLCAPILDFKHVSSSDDFYKRLDIAENDGISLDIELELYGRDGLFDKDQLFMVFENKDLLALIEHLKKCIH